MEGGINLICPFEVTAGSDVVDYQNKYLKSGIMGGIDNRELSKEQEDIDKEFERVKEMFDPSGDFFGKLLIFCWHSKRDD